ncbi:undecaprenyl-diphosphate phosphatase [Candidatus Uhrbacteria bacterium]|nr:undecaprenyl-diphosphate phosphatase [Candidatus Uhrbacteria bacterium]
MTIFQAFILGLVQGVAEFLPISSSGFLILVPKFFDWKLQDLAFDASIHLATLGGVIVALFPDVKRLFISERRVIFWILLSTIPILIGGFFLEVVFGLSFRSAEIVAVSFIVWGIILYLADHFAKEIKDATNSVGWKRSFFIGCAQAISIIPGTSRSGITITAGLFGGLSRSTATTFSFLLSIPSIAIAGSYGVWKFVNEPTDVSLFPLFVGMTTAFITSLITIRVLRTWLAGRGTFAELAIFRIILGILILIW